MMILLRMPGGIFSCRFGIACMAAMLLLGGCAGTSHHQSANAANAAAIGPYPSFSGRLIVIEPAKRWQVLIKWKAQNPERGWLRISHAATGTVVELRWQGKIMQVRDNREPAWQPIGLEQLSMRGIVIPPQTLAAILLGRMPADFKQTDEQRWESRESGSLIRLRWQPRTHKLTMIDMKHGRKATLIIQP
ncbi:MAG: hypothetical protein Q9M82_02545 [Mariprofundus sp.]|nr:hypothetical protein [Mariprofundus sp.]